MMKRIELLCPITDKAYWVNWLLTNYQGIFDASSVERYGLEERCLNRKECVLGYAQWVKFVLIAEKETCDRLLSLLPKETCDTLEIRVLSLDLP